MRDLEPGTQNFVFDATPGSDSPQLFNICAFYMNGYGAEADPTKACNVLRRAARSGHSLSRAYLYRIHLACGIPIDSDIPSIDYLYQAALQGSRMARQDLRKIAPEKADFAARFLRDAFGGVGASWFNKDQMLHGYMQSNWMETKFLVKQVGAANDVYKMKVNQHGDGIFHFAASCGCYDSIKFLIDVYHIDINHVNSQGETALLCACRAGQGRVVGLLLDRHKALASIATINGETPLHWLVSFSDQDARPLAKALIANGADVSSSTKQRVSHSIFPSTIDVDFQLAGTPLGWAVHHNRPAIARVLLENGADPH